MQVIMKNTNKFVSKLGSKNSLYFEALVGFWIRVSKVLKMAAHSIRTHNLSNKETNHCASVNNKILFTF